MKNFKIIITFLLFLSIALNVNKIQAQKQQPDTTSQKNIQAKEDLSLLQIIVLTELQRYRHYPFGNKINLPYEDTKYFIDSTFICFHNIISSGYLYWPEKDTLLFALAFQLHENGDVFSLEYYQMDMCFNRENSYGKPTFKINYQGDIQGCIGADHNCLSPTRFYKKPFPFKVQQQLKE